MIFFLFPVLYFGVNGILNYFIYSNYKTNIKTNILILGDSHTKSSINPKLYFNSLNISQSAEPYVLTYWKLKNILNDSNIDTAIIGFAPHNISAFNDLKFSDRTWSLEIFKRIYPIQEFKLLKNIEIDYPSFYKVIWKQTCFYPKLNHGNYIGNYSNTNNSSIVNVETPIKRHYYYNGEEIGISNIAVSYLDSIIKICKTHGVKPILISSPVHETYYNKIPFINTSTFEDVKLKLISKGVMVIDKTKEHYPDSLFSNVDHLNENGANRFTKEIKEILTARTLESR